MGKLRFQFKIFHKPLFGWKGSFVVTNVNIIIKTFKVMQLRLVPRKKFHLIMVLKVQ